MKSTRRRQSRMQSATTQADDDAIRHIPRLLSLVMSLMLAVVAGSLLFLSGAAGMLPGTANALSLTGSSTHQPLPASTDTPAPTATVPVTPPSISLVSPSSGKGPVGAHVTVQGTHFSGSSARLFGSTNAACSAPTGTLTTASISGGTLNDTFVWPLSYSVGAYYICAAGMSSSTASYRVLTSSPPTLSLSAASIQAGQQLTIQGSNFAGLPAGAIVALTATTVTPSSLSVTLPSGTLDDNGSFSVNWTVDNTPTGGIGIFAYAETEGSNPAVLNASATVTVLAAATVTPTVQASPSANVTTTPNGNGIGTTPGQNNSSPLGLIILLITGIILLLLLVLAVVIVMTLRNRGAHPGQAGAAAGQNGYGGSGGYGAANGYGTTGRFAATEQYPQGVTGRFSAPGQFVEQPIGGVAQWDDTDSLPGPDWQPRPMSGRQTGYQQSYDDAGASEYVPYPEQGQTGYPPNAPVDPWDNPSASYGLYPGESNQWYGGPQEQRMGNAAGGPPYSNFSPDEELFGGQSQRYGGSTQGALPGETRGAAQPNGLYDSKRMPRTGMPPSNSAGSTAPAWDNQPPPYPAPDDWPDLGGTNGPGRTPQR